MHGTAAAQATKDAAGPDEAGTDAVDVAAEKQPPSPTGERIVGAQPFAHPQQFYTANGAPDYREFYRERYRYIADAFLTPAHDADIEKGGPQQIADAVSALVWLAQGKAGAADLERAHDLFALAVKHADGDKGTYGDCFGFYAVLDAALRLKAAGRWDAAWDDVLGRFAHDGVAYLQPRLPLGDGNQDLGRMCACLLAKRLFPDLPEMVAAEAKVSAAFTAIIGQGDLYSDSRNYFEVSFHYLIRMAQELGREQEIAQSPGFRRLFASIRDAVSPNGFLPEFGAGYFSPNHYFMTPVYLEYAAALYRDPSFSAAARRYFGQLIQSGPFRETSARMAMMDCMRGPQLLDTFRASDQAVPAPEMVSGVTYRSARIGGERPGFLILRPSLTAGAPMLLMDLLGQGDHAQPEFTASIAYYEADHVPLFYQYGRYISGASRGNQVLFGAVGAAEPDPEWRAETWRTVVIPADRLVGADGRAHIDQVSIRTDDRGKDPACGLVLQDLRLSGPAGTTPICDVARSHWVGNATAVVAGRHEGERAISIQDIGNGSSIRDFARMTFDAARYTEVLCEVKWFGPRRTSASFRLSASDYRAWTEVEKTAQVMTLKKAECQRHGEDTSARLEYERYGTGDSTLVRQLVLSREGVLAVRDDILPGQAAAGRTAFTLWQMYSIDGEGPARFTSFGEAAYPSCEVGDTARYRRGMSAYFSGPAGTGVGKQVIPGLRLRNYQDIQRDRDLRTAYARTTMQAGQPTYLNLLVVPHAPDADLGGLDGATSTTHDGERSRFQTACAGVAITITISRNGSWDVRR
jgi:hypothetical protein